MDSTTIKVNNSTKSRLDTFREYKNESYDEVINKMIFIAENVKKGTELSEQTIASIERARDRIRRGNFLTESEAKKRLGL